MVKTDYRTAPGMANGWWTLHGDRVFQIAEISVRDARKSDTFAQENGKGLKMDKAK